MKKKFKKSFLSDVFQHRRQQINDKEKAKREILLTDDDFDQIKTDFKHKKRYVHKVSISICSLVVIISAVIIIASIVVNSNNFLDSDYRDSFFLETIDKKYDKSAKIESLVYSNNHCYLIALYDEDTDSMDFCLYVVKMGNSLSNIHIEYGKQVYSLTVGQRMLYILNNRFDIVDNSHLTIDYSSEELTFSFTAFIEYSCIKRILK